MRILVRIFAAIGFMLVLSVLAGVVIGFWFSSETVVSLPDRMVLNFNFSRPVLEQVQTDPLTAALGDQQVTLRVLVNALERARKDDRVAGFVANVSDVGMEPAQVEEVRAAVKRFRDSGKFAFAFADSFGEGGPSARQYWLASAFDEIWLQPLGQLGLDGPAMSVPFAREALDRFGIVADMHERHEYKGAADTFTRAEMPAPLRENYQRLLNDMKARIVADIADSRKLDAAEVSRLMDRSPLLANDALEAKLIDHIGYADQFRDAAEAKGGEEAENVDLIDYSYVAKPDVPEDTPRVALINVNGPIVRLDDETGPFGESATVSAETVVAALEEAAEDPAYSAILIRVDSPGGSVTASESIHRAILKAREAGKYIVVSMGATAASGGYWIATAADRVVADATTITGSIGVLSGKVVFGPLSERLGVNWTELTTSRNGGMWSSTRPFNAREMQRIDAMLDEIYAAFLKHVGEGRNIPENKLDALARGRIWTGQTAKELGLVDELGGMRTGFDAIRAHLNLPEEQLLRVSQLPRPETPAEQVMKILRYYITMPGLKPVAFGEILNGLQSRLGLSPAGSLYFMLPGFGETRF